MLGSYSSFPDNIHRIEAFSTPLTSKRLQQIVIEAMYALNKVNLRVEEVATPSIPDCKVCFEVGVAEGNDFNYLDAEERQRLLKALCKAPFKLLDFLVVILYQRKLEEGKKNHIRFDYYMLRLMFGEGLAEAHVFHEKGLRHTSPEDLTRLVVNKANSFSSRRVLKSIVKESSDSSKSL
jgi:hypothetical protein